MKDYKNYHRIDVHKEMISNGNIMFDLMLQSSLETNIVTINELQYEVIIQNKDGDTHSDKRYVLIKPNLTNIGDYIYVGEDIFLVIAKLSSNDVYEKFLIQLCNTSISIKGEKEPIEWDQWGNIIKWSDSEDTIIPCVVEKALVYGSADLDMPINLPDNKVKITFPYSELRFDDFKMHKENYKVRDFDYTNSYKGQGVITISGERVIK